MVCSHIQPAALSPESQLEYGAVVFCCFLQYALIVFNSWFIDFQPQGRYLLPILFFISYLAGRMGQPEQAPSLLKP